MCGRHGRFSYCLVKDTPKPRCLTENYILLAALAVVVLVSIFWLVCDRHERPCAAATGGADSPAEREFRAIFSMTSPAGKEAADVESLLTAKQ
jgi:hypothetical protein